MFGGRPGFRWWRRPPRVFIHTTDTHRCACKFRTLGNAREADDGKRGTRVAIMLAWKSWKRGPEGQPLLPTFRVQTIAICLLAAGVMQRALPTAIRCHRAASESYKQTACLRFSFPLPSSSLFLSLSLSLSLLPPRPLFQAVWNAVTYCENKVNFHPPEFMNVWEIFQHVGIHGRAGNACSGRRNYNSRLRSPRGCEIMQILDSSSRWMEGEAVF